MTSTLLRLLLVACVFAPAIGDISGDVIATTAAGGIAAVPLPPASVAAVGTLTATTVAAVSAPAAGEAVALASATAGPVAGEAAVGTVVGSAPAVAGSDTSASLTIPLGPPDSSLVWRLLENNLPIMAQLVQGISFAMAVKFACMASNILVQVSPWPQVKKWEQRCSTGETDPAPYVSIAFGGWQWCFYGTFAFLVTGRSGFLVLVHSNCMGALLGTYYIITFFRHCRDISAASSLFRYLSAVMSLVLLQMCALIMLPRERALFLSGLVASFCSFVGALSIMVTIPDVLKTKDSRSIPGLLVTAYFFSALVWVLCGWMLADPMIFCPSMVSTFASAACMVLKYHYPSKEGKEQKDCADMKCLSELVSNDAINDAIESVRIGGPVFYEKQAKYAGTSEADFALSTKMKQFVNAEPPPLSQYYGSDGTGGT